MMLFMVFSCVVVIGLFVATSRGEKRFVTGCAIAAVASLCFVGVSLYKCGERPYYRYTVDVHYLSGDVRRLDMCGYDAPAIQSYKGSYKLLCGREVVNGVVFYDLVKKEEIQNENANK